ncbi:hypothetical protein [Amaricoccus solimangrovi]|uniref:Uncharacterized protein n=1 Tax=Amaricoccus solimangrovi TaxID=2589815 RepID=A0A501WEL3_9RHOB|nr:hypothetical protein [Amaricoccus solimangrovi]TPE46780.1 hypothetical protein FJM51_21400 [Amaricoccus solimangrovi]
MIELIFVACLQSAPETCREERMLFVDAPLLGCVLGAQAELATWVARHPDWGVHHWTCRAGGASEREA